MTFLCRLTQTEIGRHPYENTRQIPQSAECGCKMSRPFTAYKWLQAFTFQVLYCCTDHDPEWLQRGFATFGHKAETVTGYYILDEDAPFYDGHYWPEYKERVLDEFEMCQKDAGDLHLFLKELGFVNPKG